MLLHIPGVGSSFAGNTYYAELNIVQNFSELKPYLTMFDSAQLEEIGDLANSFHFWGLNLLSTPQGSPFSSMLWLIPVLCLVTAWAQQFYMTKSRPVCSTQQGCMKFTMYLLPLISVVIAYTTPAAIGFLLGYFFPYRFLQSVITNKFYGPAIMGAKMEAQRVAFAGSGRSGDKTAPLSGAESLGRKNIIFLVSLRHRVRRSRKRQGRGIRKNRQGLKGVQGIILGRRNKKDGNCEEK